jgi:hypothetical protein
MKFWVCALHEGIKMCLIFALLAASLFVFRDISIRSQWLWFAGFISSIIFDIVRSKFLSGGRTAHNTRSRAICAGTDKQGREIVCGFHYKILGCYMQGACQHKQQAGA